MIIPCIALPIDLIGTSYMHADSIRQTQWPRSLRLSEGHPVSLANSAQQTDQRITAASLAAGNLSLKYKVGLPGAYE